MSNKTHWKKLHNPDYLGAYSLDNGRGGYDSIVATIKSVRVEKVTGTDGKKEDCTVMRFGENLKPMILNATNSKTLEKLFHTPYIEDWSGRKIKIDVETIKAFGEVVDALRINKNLPVEAGPVVCADCDAEIAATEKMTVAQIDAATKKRFGRPLCANCWMKHVKAEKAADTDADTGEVAGEGEATDLVASDAEGAPDAEDAVEDAVGGDTDDANS